MKQEIKEKFTKYEIARILGARSLQLAMDAPILLKLKKEKEEELNYDVIKIAEIELEAGVLPITVRRPLPKKSEKQIKKITEDELKEKIVEQKKKEIKLIEEIEEKKEEIEEIEEKEIKTEGEIMEISNPDDEEEVVEEEEVEEI